MLNLSSSVGKQTLCVFFAFLVILLTACSKPVFRSRWARETAPAIFTARFETTKGSFDLEIKRKYSPKAADRFYQLVIHGFYDKDALFYRAIPNYIVQFGTSDARKEKAWDMVKVIDEEVLLGNVKGNVSFASAGKSTRTTTLFINLKNNKELDTMRSDDGVKGFPAFGSVKNGMEVVQSLYSGYADSTMDHFGMMFTDHAAFRKKFPRLDGIIKAYIIKRT